MGHPIFPRFLFSFFFKQGKSKETLRRGGGGGGVGGIFIERGKHVRRRFLQFGNSSFGRCHCLRVLVEKREWEKKRGKDFVCCPSSSKSIRIV